jgi:hypothetical protein
VTVNVGVMEGVNVSVEVVVIVGVKDGSGVRVAVGDGVCEGALVSVGGISVGVEAGAGAVGELHAASRNKKQTKTLEGIASSVFAFALLRSDLFATPLDFSGAMTYSLFI